MVYQFSVPQVSERANPLAACEDGTQSQAADNARWQSVIYLSPNKIRDISKPMKNKQYF
tara:strand:- start:25731 stop:25907 length:177 start_codon:yes stop_codon:yes gene_type:complete